MSNEKFRRELNRAFDDMSGPPSPALSARVRSALVESRPVRTGPSWMAGLAAAVIAVIVIGVFLMAGPLNRRLPIVPIGPHSSPSASPGSTPSASPTADASLPAFVCNSYTGLVAKTTSPPAPPVAYIDGVRTGTHAGYDRITIEFSNSTPGKVVLTTQNSATFTQGASGQSVTLAGSAGLLVVVHGADEHTAYNGATDFKTGYPVLLEARQMEDFEGTVQWGLGLSKSACYRAFFLANPTRLVVDIQTS